MKTLNLGMSGGVDSSVAAHLLKEQGYDVCGLTFELCGDSAQLLESAKSVADSIGIKWKSLNLREQFKTEVMQDFVNCYAHGLTPNPCVKCNKSIKFNYLDSGCDYIATGHYAKVEFDSSKGCYFLRKSDNLAKDQSYFLYTLSQNLLAKIVFPLGSYDKAQIRAIAEELGLASAKTKDSQDVCFIPDGDHAAFITKFSGHTWPCGNFEDMDGNVLGEHKGIIKYTIGQRKGLGLSLKKPMYVYALDLERNAVILGDDEDLFRDTLEASELNWIAMDEPTEAFRCKARIRYRHREAPCTVEPRGDKIYIKFDEPQRAITAGQSVVLYDDDIVIGGGIII